MVAGTHRTEPIAVLDQRLPAVAAELREHAARLERHHADLCDIEFTIEEGRLWLLQVRVGKRSPQAALRIAIDMAEDEDFPLSKADAVERVRSLLAQPPTVATSRDRSVTPLATGLPASPGVASGPIALTPEAAVAAADAGQTPILVRAETSPDDVHGMARAAGILTSRGGLASHAAVVARGWGIPAVVGAEALLFGEGTVAVGDTILRADEVITIDGGTGEVFAGAITGETEVAPEARTLLGWAKELGISVGEEHAGDASTAPAAPALAPARAVSPDDCIRVVAVKGFATLDALAEAVQSAADDVRPVVDQLETDALVTTTAGAYRLTEAGMARADALLDAERSAWGIETAGAALDAFHELDLRMKDTVTAWQLRDPAAQVINDHSDPEYDRSVLERLGALHADTWDWLEPHTAAAPRLATYLARLELANERAQGGDQKYVASPRVDSYHGIWFELHEDLIHLAGRTREDEAAAGRA